MPTYAIYKRLKNKNRLKVKQWEKIFHANSNQKRPGAAILTSDKIDFKTNVQETKKDVI